MSLFSKKNYINYNKNFLEKSYENALQIREYLIKIINF